MTTAQDSKNRWPITVSIMLATIMNSLDTTIANVALPHIQGSVSASQDQITWVLTSYIISAAIMTPLSGWLAVKIGRKQLFLLSIAGFTVASMLCGISTSLAEIVGFRLLQGLFGASLIPLSQATLLDINPPEKHGQAMAIWGMGAILGPIMGPALGGYLTENFDWRWVFFINLPVGIFAFLGVLFFISKDKLTQRQAVRFPGFRGADHVHRRLSGDARPGAKPGLVRTSPRSGRSYDHRPHRAVGLHRAHAVGRASVLRPRPDGATATS